MTVVPRPDVTVGSGRADPQTIGADGRVIGQPAEGKLPRIGRRGRKINGQRVALNQVGIERSSCVALPRTCSGRAKIVEAEGAINMPGLDEDGQAEMAAGIADVARQARADARELDPPH